MRTSDEIVKRIAEVIGDDFLGFERQVLAVHLPEGKLEEAGFGKVDATWEPMPVDPTSITGEIRSYMPFAWMKVREHRGISASRSVSKVRAWLWLLGNDGLLADFEAAPYENYGAPKLAFVCKELKIPIPKDEAIQNMAAGKKCCEDCTEGCGQ